MIKARLIYDTLTRVACIDDNAIMMDKADYNVSKLDKYASDRGPDLFAAFSLHSHLSSRSSIVATGMSAAWSWARPKQLAATLFPRQLSFLSSHSSNSQSFSTSNPHPHPQPQANASCSLDSVSTLGEDDGIDAGCFGSVVKVLIEPKRVKFNLYPVVLRQSKSFRTTLDAEKLNNGGVLDLSGTTLDPVTFKLYAGVLYLNRPPTEWQYEQLIPAYLVAQKVMDTHASNLAKL